MARTLNPPVIAVDALLALPARLREDALRVAAPDLAAAVAEVTAAPETLLSWRSDAAQLIAAFLDKTTAHACRAADRRNKVADVLTRTASSNTVGGLLSGSRTPTLTLLAGDLATVASRLNQADALTEPVDPATVGDWVARLGDDVRASTVEILCRDLHNPVLAGAVLAVDHAAGLAGLAASPLASFADEDDEQNNAAVHTVLTVRYCLEYARGPVTPALAGLLATIHPSALHALPPFTVSADAAPVLLGSDSAELACAAAAAGHVDDTLILARFRQAPAQVRKALLTSTVSAAAAEIMAREWEHDPLSKVNPVTILSRFPALSATARLRLMRDAKPDEFVDMIVGRDTAGMHWQISWEPGLLTTVIADLCASVPYPGPAVEGAHLAQSSPGLVLAALTSRLWANGYHTNGGYNSEMVMADWPAVKESIDAFIVHGRGLIGQLLKRPEVVTGQLTLERILTACNGDPSRFATVISLADGWDGTVDDLIEASALVAV
jgi:hypothetical protein